MLYDILMLPNGLKPSLAKPSHTLQESAVMMPKIVSEPHSP